MIFRTMMSSSRHAMRHAKQHGPRCSFGHFDCVVTYDPNVEGCGVFRFPGAFPDVRLWLPHIAEGVEQGFRQCQERGERFFSVRIEITHVRYNTVDSSPEVFRQLGRRLVTDELLGRTEAIPPLAPAWRTPDVLAVARRIRDARDFAALSILADALEEAGCGLGLLLDHCRRAADHRGSCWAVEMALDELSPPEPFASALNLPAPAAPVGP